MKKPPAKMLKYLDEARAFEAANKISKASQSAKQAYKLAEEHLPVGHPDRKEVAWVLGSLLLTLGDQEVAEKLLREAGKLGPDPDAEDRAVARNNESSLLLGGKITNDTARHIEEAAEYARQQLSRDNPHLFIALANLGKLRLRQEHFREAERLFKEVLEHRRQSHQSEQLLIDAFQDLGTLHLATKRPDLAEPFLRDALNRHEALGTDALTTAPF